MTAAWRPVGMYVCNRDHELLAGQDVVERQRRALIQNFRMKHPPPANEPCRMLCCCGRRRRRSIVGRRTIAVEAALQPASCIFILHEVVTAEQAAIAWKAVGAAVKGHGLCAIMAIVVATQAAVDSAVGSEPHVRGVVRGVGSVHSACARSVAGLQRLLVETGRRLILTAAARSALKACSPGRGLGIVGRTAGGPPVARWESLAANVVAGERTAFPWAG